MPDRVGQQLANYRLIRTLGQGGFADVYLGEHVYLNTPAAIKVLQMRLTDEDKRSFLEEARTIARLKHPAIVRILEYDVVESIPFLVMEYAPNGTLRHTHPKGTALPPAAIVPYVRQVAAALQYAHDQKLMHRVSRAKYMKALSFADHGSVDLERLERPQKSGLDENYRHSCSSMQGKRWTGSLPPFTSLCRDQ